MLVLLVCGLLKEGKGKINQTVGKARVCLVHLLHS